MAASNTKDCFRECVGKHIRGVLFDALPAGRSDLAPGTKTLIFEDGTGLTISSNGSFWLENEREIEHAIEEHRAKLSQLKNEIEEVITVATGRAPVKKKRKR